MKAQTFLPRQWGGWLGVGVEGQLLFSERSLSSGPPKSTFRADPTANRAQAAAENEGKPEDDGEEMRKESKRKRGSWVSQVLGFATHASSFHLAGHHQLPLINHTMAW